MKKKKIIIKRVWLTCDGPNGIQQDGHWQETCLRQLKQKIAYVTTCGQRLFQAFNDKMEYESGIFGRARIVRMLDYCWCIGGQMRVERYIRHDKRETKDNRDHTHTFLSIIHCFFCTDNTIFRHKIYLVSNHDTRSTRERGRPVYGRG